MPFHSFISVMLNSDSTSSDPPLLARNIATAISSCIDSRRESDRGSRRRTTMEEPRMQDVLPDGGVIRKMWLGEADRYRDHLLAARRRQPAQPVRRRGVGRVRAQLCRSIARHRRGHPRLLRRRHDARRRRAAADRAAARARGRGRVQHREAVAEPRRRLGAARAHAARRAQSRHQVPAHGLPRRQPAHAAAGAQVRRRTDLRFRQRGRRGRERRGRRRCRCLREIVADQHGFATAMLDVQARLLRPVCTITPPADRRPRPRRARRRPRRARRTARTATP